MLRVAAARGERDDEGRRAEQQDGERESDRERLAAFCHENGCEAAASNQEAAAQDVVVTVTTSKGPAPIGCWA